MSLETLTRFPDYSRARTTLGNAYMRKGQFAEALEQFTALVAVSREWDNLRALAVGHAYAGNITEARQLQDELLATDAPLYHIGRVYGALGEMDLAFEWMERAVETNQGTLADLLITPGLDPTQPRPRPYSQILPSSPSPPGSNSAARGDASTARRFLIRSHPKMNSRATRPPR